MTTLSLDDCALSYEDTGEGRPLVFLHGGWQNATAWRPQVERFASENRVITLDVRGHGRTGATDRRRYSVDLFADDLEELLDRLEIDRPILCGLSLGSMVVQTYLDRHPDRAAGAILAGPVRSIPPYDVPRAVKPFVSPLPAITASLSTAGTEATFRSLLLSTRTTTGGPWLAVDSSVRAEAFDALEDVSRAEFRKIFRALYRFDPPGLSHVATPTLVVYGDHEAPPVKRQGERIAASVDGGTRVELPDAGHLVNQDSPEAFNAAAAEFLDGLDAAS